MALAPKLLLGVGGVAVVAGGALLWRAFGELVYFDFIAGAFIGCFF